MTFTWDLTLGNLLTLLGMAFAAGGIYFRIGTIEKKLDDFISKDVVDAKVTGLQREINGLAHRLNTEGH